MEIRQTHANVRGRYRSYSVNDLTEAYNLVLKQGLPVERVAKRFGIPITTLKDRVKGRVHIDTIKSGPPTLFTQEQEAFLSQHLVTMAEIGYGYSRQETINLATDYAVHVPNPAEAAAPENSEAKMFLEKRGGQILQNVTVAKVRKTMSKVVGGKPITEDSVYDNMKAHVAQQKQNKTKSSVRKTQNSTRAQQVHNAAVATPQPSTSGLNHQGQDHNQDASDVSDSADEQDTELCSVCGRFTPLELKYCVSLTIVKWGCCDKCDRWVHLRFCSPVKVLRRSDPFLCPKCTEEE